MTSPSKPQDLVERALEASTADSCIVIVEEASSANLRWAANTLTTNGVTRSRRIVVISAVGGQTGTAAGVVSRTAIDLDTINDVVRASELAANDNSEAEDAQPIVGDAPASADWDEPPRQTDIGVFARFTPGLGDMLASARVADRVIAGFAAHVLTSTYLGSSTGLRLRHDQPTGTVEITARATDGGRSAWVGVGSPDFTDVDAAALDATLQQRLAWAQKRVRLEPGRYQTLLPPTAVADLMIYLYWTATARDAHEGRTVFSRPGGGTRVGDRLSELPVTLRSDPAAPGLQCAPFLVTAGSSSTTSVFDNGLPVGPVTWIRDGQLDSLITTRHSAALTGLPMRPVVDNLILEAGSDGRDLDAMVASTDRGLLLTCLWYIREVDPRTLLLTGLTRDGIYLIDEGEVVGAVNNFRFNESPVDLLGRISEAGATVPTLPREWNDYFTRTAMPPLRIPDFNMSSVSPAE
ncbi:MAG: metallopeptidase TldD-related protein [Actinomycetes bacterium]